TPPTPTPPDRGSGAREPSCWPPRVPGPAGALLGVVAAWSAGMVAAAPTCAHLAYAGRDADGIGEQLALDQGRDVGTAGDVAAPPFAQRIVRPSGRGSPDRARPGLGLAGRYLHRTGRMA